MRGYVVWCFKFRLCDEVNISLISEAPAAPYFYTTNVTIVLKQIYNVLILLLSLIILCVYTLFGLHL